MVKIVICSLLISSIVFDCETRGGGNSLVLDVTYVNQREAFSMAYDGKDSIIYRQYWNNQSNKDSAETLISAISKSEISKLRSLFKKIKLSEINTQYPDNSIVDGPFLGLSIKTSESDVVVYPESDRMTMELRNLLSFIYFLKENHKFISSSRSYHFRSSPRIPMEVNKPGVLKFLPHDTISVKDL